jgi:hypothetical protein
VTDLPRESFPLVVAPPGGFEDAVRRGRRIRRHRTGGTGGAALLVVGAITFSTMGGNGATQSLDTAHRPVGEHVSPSGWSSQSASPTPSPTGTVAPSATTTPYVAGSQPPATSASPAAAPASPASSPTVRPTRGTAGGPSPRYATRPKITRTGPFTSTDTACLRANDGREWCSSATTSVTDTAYVLTYRLCRPIDADKGALVLNRRQEVDFRATDVARNDTVWTWSAGQPVVPAQLRLEVDAGSCYDWVTHWDGYDDFGYTPRAGSYRLTAALFSATPYTATKDFQHD